MRTLTILCAVLVATAAVGEEQALRNWKAGYYAEVTRAEKAGEIKTEAQLEAMLAAAVTGNKVKDVTDYLVAANARAKKLKAAKEKAVKAGKK